MKKNEFQIPVVVPLSKLHSFMWRSNKMLSGDFSLLKDSIEEFGLLYPLVVVKHEEEDDVYIVVDGASRCRALRELGYDAAPVIVLDLPAHKQAILSFVLNNARGVSQVSKMQEIVVFLNVCGMFAEEISAALGMPLEQVDRILDTFVLAAGFHAPHPGS